MNERTGRDGPVWICVQAKHICRADPRAVERFFKASNPEEAGHPPVTVLKPLHGAEPGLADICIAGQLVTAQYLKLELGAFPTVARLAERCFEIPAFATSHPFEQPGYKSGNAAR